ncbi:MAG: hypothetical protein M3P43_01900 [Actinomycetota bacterium]|nr:hypothetical protein [Actinomycetota bacterium]
MRAGVVVSLLAFSSLLLPACGGHEAVAPEGVFFPTLAKSQDTWPAALASGSLAEKGGCVFLMPGDVLLIWPHEATVERTGAGRLRITVDGKLVGQTGDEVHSGVAFSVSRGTPWVKQ